MNQFIQRLANWLGNEVIIKGLAESRTFQRMALKTHTTLNELEKMGTQHLESTLKEFGNAAGEHSPSASRSSGPPKAPLRGISGFVAAFFKEIRKDITGMK